MTGRRQVSYELLDKATGASQALQACLETLSDGMDNDAVREALGMDGHALEGDSRMSDDAAASSALQKVNLSRYLSKSTSPHIMPENAACIYKQQACVSRSLCRTRTSVEWPLLLIDTDG